MLATATCKFCAADSLVDLEPRASFSDMISRIQMIIALAQTLSRLTNAHIKVETLEPICIFCGIGLLQSLLATEAYGIDLSIAFF